MSRTTTNLFREAAFAQDTGEALVFLIEITHADLPEGTIRVCTGEAEVTSNGDSYSPFPLGVSLPPDEDGMITGVEMWVDAIDRSIAYAIRTIETAPTVALSAVLASAPDDLIAGPLEFEARRIRGDQYKIRAGLEYLTWLGDAYPAYRITPETMPGAFA